MSYSSLDLQNLATSTWADLGQPSNITPAYISGWFVESGNLGGLNNKTFNSFYVSGGSAITDGNGNFDGSEADIYKLMYTITYWRGQSASLLSNGGSFWLSIQEGDTRLTRANVADLMRAAKEEAESAQKQLGFALHDYNLRLSTPQSVNAAQPPPWPVV